MKKLILFILLLILAGVAAAPYVVGIIFKKHYLALVDNINQEPGIKIIVKNYQNGWIKSHVTLAVESQTTVREKIVHSTLLDLDQVIAHGPFVYNLAEHKFNYAAANIQNLIYSSHQSHSKKHLLAEVNSTVFFDQDWDNRFYIPEFTFSFSPLGSIASKEINGVINFKVDDDKILSSRSKIGLSAVAFNLFDKTPQKISISLQPITNDNQAIRHANGLWNTESHTRMTNLSAKVNEKEIISIQNLNTQNFGTVRNTLLYDYLLSLNFSKMSLPEWSGIDLHESALSFGVQNISVNGIKDYRGHLGHPSNYQFNDAKLFNLLTPTTTLTFKGDIKTDMGQLRFNSQIYLPPNTPMPTTLDQITQSYVADMQVAVSIALARKLGENFAKQTTPEASPQDQFTQTVFALVSANKLPADRAQAILQLRKNNLAPAIFASQLNDLKLTAEMQTAILQANTQFPVVSIDHQNVTRINPVDTWARDGLLTEKGDQYLSTIQFKNAHFYVNGIDVTNKAHQNKGTAGTPLPAAAS